MALEECVTLAEMAENSVKFDFALCIVLQEQVLIKKKLATLLLL